MAELYEVVIVQSYDQQQCVTRFNYELTGAPAAVTGSFGLVSAMGMISAGGVYPASTLFAAWRAVVNVGVIFNSVVAFNVFDVTDFYSTPFLPNTIGQNSGAGLMSAFASYGFRTNQVRRDIRRGQKRLVGVSEAAVNDFGSLISAQQTVNDALAAKFTEVLVYNDEGQNLSYAPVVAGKEKRPTESDPTKEAYYYYETYAEQSQHLARSVVWAANTEITTQNSRKRGRGA